MSRIQKTTTDQARPATTWTIDPAHSTVAFSVKHLMIAKVHGRFSDVTANLHLDEANPAESRLDADIQVASIDTGTADRDTHLRSPDFFHVDEHPTITFRSTQVEVDGPERARVTGDLTIRGTTRPVTLDVVRDGSGPDPWGHQRTAYTATGTIDRRDYGLTWNQVLEAGGFLVGDQIQIRLEVQLVKQE